ISGIEEEHGPVVYAVLQRESAALELVVCLTAGQVRPFQRGGETGSGNRGFPCETGRLSFFSYHHF
ncbi:MAG: hypothetical protein LBP60_07230, partial [Spirochaetaceae bacterium]|nr:hypothetical protein [Spirochaetaceae bacterium]